MNKAVFIVFNQALTERVEFILSELKISGYTPCVFKIKVYNAGEAGRAILPEQMHSVS